MIIIEIKNHGDVINKAIGDEVSAIADGLGIGAQRDAFIEAQIAKEVRTALQEKGIEASVTTGIPPELTTAADIALPAAVAGMVGAAVGYAAARVLK